MLQFAISLNLRPEFLSRDRHTLKAHCASLPDIRIVLRCRSRAKVYPSIIASVDVFMVGIVRRPFACHVEESQPICTVCRAVDPDQHVSFTDRSGRRASLGLSAPIDFPAKDAGFGIVMQKLLKARLGEDMCLARHDEFLSS